MTNTQELIAICKSNFSYIQSIRRDLHMHPELAFNEYRTASVIERELRKLNGVNIKTGIGKTGIVAQFEGKHNPDKVVMLRFDMDALPIQEENDVEYASVVPNVSHKCGHDGHVAAGLSIARILHGIKDEIHGTIKFIFQPAEEGANGAVSMISDGALEDPKPNAALGFHVWNEKQIGWFGISSGPIMAGVDDFKITITGKGGHGAIPDMTADPIIASAQIISALQTIVSRNISPINTAVVSVTKIESGTAFNIIPQSAEMLGTIRAFDENVRMVILNRLQEITNQIASAMNCRAEIIINHLAPPVINDDKITQIILPIASEVFPGAIIDTSFKTMGAEDVSFFLERVPGCFIMVGSSNIEKGYSHSHHHPKFDFDEYALVEAVTLLVLAAKKILS